MKGLPIRNQVLGLMEGDLILVLWLHVKNIVYEVTDHFGDRFNVGSINLIIVGYWVVLVIDEVVVDIKDLSL